MSECRCGKEDCPGPENCVCGDTCGCPAGVGKAIANPAPALSMTEIVRHLRPGPTRRWDADRLQ